MFGANAFGSAYFADGSSTSGGRVYIICGTGFAAPAFAWFPFAGAWCVTITPTPPPTPSGSGGAYRRFKPRLLTADDVRRLIGKHNGLLVREQLTEDELQMLKDMKLTGYIVTDELPEEEEIQVLQMLGWL